MLTELDIKKNKATYLVAIEKYNVCTPELVEKLDSLGFFLAPASTMLNLHNAFPGGLVAHLLHVTTLAMKFNEVYGEKIKSNKESVARVSLLHGIGKSELYIPCTSDWHRKTLGKMYEFNEKLTSMTVGERSIHYIISNGNAGILSDIEYQAIINHDKDLVEDKMAKWHTNPLGVLLRQSVDVAIMEEKNNG